MAGVDGLTQREIARNRLKSDIEEFLKKGEKITKCAPGETGYVATKHIVINKDKYYKERRRHNKQIELMQEDLWGT